MRGSFRTAVVAALLVAPMLVGIWTLPAGATEVGQTAPSLTVKELGGGLFDLGSLRGKVVIVSFWACWCPPCRAEMPALDAFYRRYHAQGVEMIGLSADRPHDRDDVQAAMRAFTYPAAMLSDAVVNGFGDPRTLPALFVVDAQGVVRAELGQDGTPVTEQRLAATVLPLLPAGRQ